MASQVVAGLVGAAIGVMMTTAIAISIGPKRCPACSECPQAQPQPQPQPQPPVVADAGAAEADIDGGPDIGDVTCSVDEVACLLADRPPACCAVYSSSRRRAPSDSLTADQIRTVVTHLRSQVAECGDHSNARGTVKVNVRVAPDGSVSRVEIRSTPDRALGECVADIFLAVRFPASQQGVSFTYPFVF